MMAFVAYYDNRKSKNNTQVVIFQYRKTNRRLLFTKKQKLVLQVKKEIALRPSKYALSAKCHLRKYAIVLSRRSIIINQCWLDN